MPATLRGLSCFHFRRTRLSRLAAAAALAMTLVHATVAESSILRVRADSWMPYNGAPGDDLPGYAIELARVVFAKHEIEIDYGTQDWGEALSAARAGVIHAVVGANREEADELVLPAEPVGAASVCVMTRRDSAWQYENVRSFRGLRLGVIKDYSYWPGLDDYLTALPEGSDAIVRVEGDDALPMLLSLLETGKIDALVETGVVLLWHLRQHGRKASDFRIVYRHQADPIYFAFTNDAEGRRFASLWDTGLKALRDSGQLDSILRRYGVFDWK